MAIFATNLSAPMHVWSDSHVFFWERKQIYAWGNAYNLVTFAYHSSSVIPILPYTATLLDLRIIQHKLCPDLLFQEDRL
jgi:hypothetical protein